MIQAMRPEIALEVLRLPSMGSGITLWSGFKGASHLGERGLPAETVGKKAAEALILELKSAASVDVHLADQLIPYLALAGGSYTSREISLHARTNIWTAEHFLDRKISVSVRMLGSSSSKPEFMPIGQIRRAVPLQIGFYVFPDLLAPVNSGMPLAEHIRLEVKQLLHGCSPLRQV